MYRKNAVRNVTYGVFLFLYPVLRVTFLYLFIYTFAPL